MKKLTFILLLAVTGFFGYVKYPEVWYKVLHKGINISGTIDIAPRLEAKADRPNTTCFVVIKNSDEIPLAIKRFVNPSFPLKFSINNEDMLLSKVWGDPLKIEVQVNNHGKVGTLEPGDMYGELEKPLGFYAKNVRVNVDRRIAIPSLYAGQKRDKFEVMFGYSAR
jgi:hypothetical protein